MQVGDKCPLGRVFHFALKCEVHVEFCWPSRPSFTIRYAIACKLGSLDYP